jgi:hypothetical protein
VLESVGECWRVNFDKKILYNRHELGIVWHVPSGRVKMKSSAGEFFRVFRVFRG